MKNKIISIMLSCLLALSFAQIGVFALEEEALDETGAVEDDSDYINEEDESSEDIDNTNDEDLDSTKEDDDDSDDINEDDDYQLGKYMVMTALLNFREEPSLDSEVITILSMGTEVTLHSVEDAWGNVTVDEQSGWLMMDYVEYVGYLDDYAANWRIIDVSSHQGNIDWEKVKADGVDGAILRIGRRATKSKSIDEDTKFAENYQGALEAELHVGAYFFSAALSVEEALEEASWLVEKIQQDDLKFDLPIFFDVELNEQAALGKETCTSMVQAFCDYLIEHAYYPGVYSNLWWTENVLDMAAFSNYAVWVAQYSSKLDYKGRHNIWQFTSSGRVDGIEGNVDINHCYTDFPKYISDNDYNHIKIEGEHIYGDWVTVRESSCTEHGQESVLCLHCGIVLATRLLPLKEHSPSAKWEIEKAPTEFEDGELVLKCEDCDFVLKRQNIIDFNSSHVHDFTDEWISVEEPSCVSEGEKILKCLECDTVILSHFIERTAHEGDEWIIISPTCTNDGRRFLNCKHCDIQMEQELIAALGHSVEEWEIIKEPSVTEFGERSGECMVCGEMISEQIPKKLLQLKGDLDLDGFVRASEARRILRFSARLETLTPDEEWLADLNDDGEVTAADARIALRVSARLEEAIYA